MMADYHKTENQQLNCMKTEVVTKEHFEAMVSRVCSACGLKEVSLIAGQRNCTGRVAGPYGAQIFVGLYGTWTGSTVTWDLNIGTRWFNSFTNPAFDINTTDAEVIVNLILNHKGA